MKTYNDLFTLFAYAFPFIVIGFGCIYLTVTDKKRGENYHE